MTVHAPVYITVNATWRNLVIDILPEEYIAHSSDLIWAVDNDKILVFANDKYIDYMSRTLGLAVSVNTRVNAPDGNVSTTDKWDYFYTRAMKGEHFHIITNFAPTETAMLVDASFIPLIKDGEVIGTACLVRHASSLIDREDGDQTDNNSLRSRS